MSATRDPLKPENRPDGPVNEPIADPKFYSCFISYASSDDAFATKLRASLQQNGVSCWFAPHDMKIGDPIRQRIDDEIRRHDKLLLLLSKHSVQSDWVRDEVETCLEIERREGRHVLFPIRLDDAAQSTRQAWAALIRRQRHMGDFTAWRQSQAYASALQRLLRDLTMGSADSKRDGKSFRRVYFENFATPASVSPDIWLIGRRDPWSGSVANRRHRLVNKSGDETAAYASFIKYVEAGALVDQAFAKVSLTVQLDGALSKHAAAGLLYRATREPDEYYGFAMSVGGTVSWILVEDMRATVLHTWDLDGHRDGQPAQLRIESTPNQIDLHVGDRLFHTIQAPERSQGNAGVFAMGRGRFLFSDLSVYLPTR